MSNLDDSRTLRDRNILNSEAGVSTVNLVGAKLNVHDFVSATSKKGSPTTPSTCSHVTYPAQSLSLSHSSSASDVTDDHVLNDSECLENSSAHGSTVTGVRELSAVAVTPPIPSSDNNSCPELRFDLEEGEPEVGGQGHANHPIPGPNADRPISCSNSAATRSPPLSRGTFGLTLAPHVCQGPLTIGHRYGAVSAGGLGSNAIGTAGNIQRQHLKNPVLLRVARALLSRLEGLKKLLLRYKARDW